MRTSSIRRTVHSYSYAQKPAFAHTSAMDALVLSRIQFAANISFHILFPTINIALCWFLVYFRLRNSAAKGTKDAAAWEEAYYLWTKVFALTFALGVVSGVTMSFQFGTNW